MIGYQIEGQYVGTDNFSALVEGIFNISGLEQSNFIPSISLLNGFRFGKKTQRAVALPFSCGLAGGLPVSRSAILFRFVL
jgi:hypothetical protein